MRFILLLSVSLIALPAAAQDKPPPLWREVPIFALDLDGNRKFALRRAEKGEGIYFDRDSDGLAEKGDWLGPQDGFLVIDRNGDGRISDGQELLIHYNYDGRYGLQRADYNNDGRLDRRDGLLWKNLRVWRDLNQDGRSTPEELFSLDDLGIEWIDISNTGGFFTQRVEGKRRTRPARIVKLNYDAADKKRISHEELAHLAQFLPDLPQQNKVPGLRALMALDNDGSNSAFSLTQRLVGLALAELFTAEGVGLAEDIIFRRAGIDQSARNFFGPLIDARRVVLPFLLAGEEIPPRRDFSFWEVYQAEILYDRIRKEQTARLWWQGEGASLFIGGAAHIDPARGRLDKGARLDPAQLEKLRVRAAVLDMQAAENYWRAVVSFIDYVLGFENLAPADYEMLAGTVAERGGGLSLETVIRNAVRLAPLEIRAAAQGENFLAGDYERKLSLRGLFEEMRRKTDLQHVILSRQVTRHIKNCCRSPDEIMNLLRRGGFEVTDMSANVQAEDHPLRHFGYVRVLRAEAPSKGQSRQGKGDRYEITLYFTREGFDWAHALLQSL